MEPEGWMKERWMGAAGWETPGKGWVPERAGRGREEEERGVMGKVEWMSLEVLVFQIRMRAEGEEVVREREGSKKPDSRAMGPTERGQ